MTAFAKTKFPKNFLTFAAFAVSPKHILIVHYQRERERDVERERDLISYCLSKKKYIYRSTLTLEAFIETIRKIFLFPLLFISFSRYLIFIILEP